jgi:hypothetical protein
LMPHVKITELLTEIDQWTNIGDPFLHLRFPPKGLLNNNLYRTQEIGYVSCSEKLHETCNCVTVSGRATLVEGYEHLE